MSKNKVNPKYEQKTHLVLCKKKTYNRKNHYLQKIVLEIHRINLKNINNTVDIKGGISTITNIIIK